MGAKDGNAKFKGRSIMTLYKIQIVRLLGFSASVPIIASQEHDLNFVEHLNFAFVCHARGLAFIYCRPGKHSPSACILLLPTNRLEKKCI